MSDTTRSTPACDLSGIREAVCVHTDKITDSCLAKDCIEDLHVYLTVESQCTLDKAVSAKARFVELMHVAIQLDPVPYSAGYYTVDITYYYRVIADAVMQAGRPCTITGLAVFSKRLVLFGGETTARIYSSRSYKNCLCKKGLQEASAPEAIVEIVDPMILGSRVQEVCACNCCATDTPQIPQGILDCFEEELVLGGECKRLLVTIGQFSIARLERGTQSAHSDLRLLHPHQKLPECLRYVGRKSLRGVQPDRFPDGRLFPRQERYLHPARGKLHLVQPDGKQITKGSAARHSPFVTGFLFCAAPRTSRPRARPTSCFCPPRCEAASARAACLPALPRMPPRSASRRPQCG